MGALLPLVSDSRLRSEALPRRRNIRGNVPSDSLLSGDEFNAENPIWLEAFCRE